MVEKLIHTDVTEFNKDTLKKLKPYFDTNVVFADSVDRHQWFQNLLTLAKHNLSIAHCIQHNHTGRNIIESAFRDTMYPNCYDPVFENQIVCYSGIKSADSMQLVDNTVTGTKHWISLVHQADFGVFVVPSGDTDAYILIDFAGSNPTIDMSYVTLMGMEIARPGSISIDKYTLPETHMLGYRLWEATAQKFFYAVSMHYYGFITNYLGLIISLYRDLGTYIEQNKITGAEFEFKKLGLEISGLKMMWEDNLSSLDTVDPSDSLWHRRNTQYTMSKNTLINMISLILQICDSRWLDAKSPGNQRFRDALTFCSHMQPLFKNLEERHFVRL